MNHFKTASNGLYLWMNDFLVGYGQSIFVNACGVIGGPGVVDKAAPPVPAVFGCDPSLVIASATAIYLMYSLISYVGHMLGAAGANQAAIK